MDTTRHERIKALFLAALETAPEDRSHFWEHHPDCDPELRRHVQELLAHDSALTSSSWVSPLADLSHCGAIGPAPGAGSSADTPAPDVERPAAPAVGRIGEYRILGWLGEGATADVYCAEQPSPRRRVALKVLRGPLVSTSRRRRFEHEAQLLARLRHPGIAQVFEAGSTELAGRPSAFYVMELVDGLPLTRWADARGLDLRRRLELFTRVCEAVQHAHQNGVIHRDLKPANILVDSSGQPKVLDFGVARSTDADLKSTRAATEPGRLVGTIPYMSPEQVAADPERLDVRSDVYSLGVVLYELLSGRLPYPPRESLQGLVDQISRAPPLRLRQLGVAVDDELEAIALKCLQKQPDDRYQSVSELMQDIRRLLADEPILARPPPALRRLRKFARRNKVLAAGLSTTLLALTLGSIGTAWQAIRAARHAHAEARHRRIAEQTTGLLKDVLTLANPYVAQGRDTSLLREMLEEADRKATEMLPREPEAVAPVLETIGMTYRSLGFLDRADPALRRALSLRQELFGELHPEVASSLYGLGLVLQDKGDYAGAEALLRRALAIRRRVFVNGHPDLVHSLNALAMLLNERDDPAAAEPLLREALALHNGLAVADEATRAALLGNLALVLSVKGDAASAEPLVKQALELSRTLSGSDHPQVANQLNNLALLYRERGDLAAAEHLFREVVAIDRKLFTQGHPALCRAMLNLALVLQDKGDHAEAERVLREVVRMEQEHPDKTKPQELAHAMDSLAVSLYFRGDFASAEGLLRDALAILRDPSNPHPRYLAACLDHLAGTLRAKGEPAAAEPFVRQAIDLRRTFQPGHPDVADSLIVLGRILIARQDYAGAEPVLLECLEIRRKKLPENHWAVPHTASILGGCLAALGRYEEAEPLLVDGYSRLLVVLGAAHERTVEAVHRGISLYEAWGRPDKAAEWRTMLERAEPATWPSARP